MVSVIAINYRKSRVCQTGPKERKINAKFQKFQSESCNFLRRRILNICGTAAVEVDLSDSRWPVPNRYLQAADARSAGGKNQAARSYQRSLSGSESVS